MRLEMASQVPRMLHRSRKLRIQPVSGIFLETLQQVCLSLSWLLAWGLHDFAGMGCKREQQLQGHGAGSWQATCEEALSRLLENVI